MVTIKTKDELAILREGGKILADIMKKLKAEIRPGANTGRLERTACSLIEKAGGRPSFKGYKTGRASAAFPTALCVSINDEIVHTPSLPPRVLKSGDIVSLDLGMEYPFRAKSVKGASAEAGGYYTDMAVTVGVGRISEEAREIIRVTETALKLAVKRIKPGGTLNDMAEKIQNFVEANGFSVVRDLVGHGVGYAVHEDPQIPNYVSADGRFDNFVFRPGMVLAIEPMVNAGSYEIQSMPDGMTIKTADGRLSAHFEHTIAITETGCEVITKS